MDVNYHILKNTIVINYDGKCFKVERESELGTKIIWMIRDGRLDEIPEVVDIAANIAKVSKDKFCVVNGEIYSYGKKVHPYIAEKIIEFQRDNIPFDYLLNFWNNVQMNPSEVSRNDLYRFLEAGEYPLTPDGYIIAYKRITRDYLDVWTRTIDNSIGANPAMPREEVCSDNRITCAPGLHVASFDYAKNIYYSGDRSLNMIEVKVHPMNVVSVPYDYNHSKMRTCGYEVIANVYEEHDAVILTDAKYVDDEYLPVVEEHAAAAEQATATEATKICDPAVNENSKHADLTVKIGNLRYTSQEIIDFGSAENLGKYLLDLGYTKQKPSRYPMGFKYLSIDFKLIDLYRRLDNLKYRYVCLYKDLANDETICLSWVID